MAEPDISPLARSLAEQNEVDWRRLIGSGPGGRITERDVFAYLAGATAASARAPLLEGHEVWRGEDAGSSQPDAASAPADSALHAFDEALLLTDDPLEEGRDDPSPYEVAALGSQGRPDDDALGLEFGLEREFGLESDAILERPDPEARLASPSNEDISEDGGEDVVLFEAPPEPAGQTSAVRFEKSFDNLDFDDLRVGDRQVDDWDADAPDAGDQGHGDMPGTGLGEDDLDLLEDANRGGAAQPYDANGSSPGQDNRHGDHLGDYDGEDDVPGSSAEPELAAVPGDEEGEEPQPELSKLPLMSHGLLLRSRIDLVPVAAAQAAVGRALGQGDRVALAAFLVRAAARALESRREDARIALAVLSGEGLGVAAIDGAARMGFAELLETVTELAASGRMVERDEAALVVADLSAYAVDEAVLQIGVPVLTLGRVRANGGDGRAYGTLSLSGDLGDLSPVRAADLLSRTTALLGSPVELVL